MKKEYRIDSFKPLIDENSAILILGTMPSVKSLEGQEYYGNRQNAFWPILFGVVEEEVTEDYEQKKQLLVRYKIALWDVLQSCEREGSLDSKIKGERPNDIKGLLIAYPALKTIVFSSQKAAQYFKKYIGMIEGITFVTMPSPSGANARMSLQEKLNHWKTIKSFI